ncbi:hypothetical protein ACNPNP_00870 [Microbacterium sp. AGC85]
MTTIRTAQRAQQLERRAPSGSFIRNAGLYVYTFYVVYNPTFSSSFLVSKFVILSALAVVIMVHAMLGRHRPLRLLAYPPLRMLLIMLFALSLYVAVVRIIAQPEVADVVDLRLVQNNIMLLMAIHGAFILHVCKSRGFTAESTLRMLYKLAAFQGVWALASFVIPPLKTISNSLYQLSAGEREFTVAARIYGFMGEFTFVTPIYHAMLAAIAVYFALAYGFRGVRYIPLILVSILLNGRTGLIVFVAMVFVIVLWRMLQGRGVFAAIGILLGIGAVGGLAWNLINQYVPATAAFIERFISETDALLDGSREGTYAVLYDQLVTVPEGFGLIFGTGDHVYKNTGELQFRADVGFTNDLFMGGLVYVVLGYAALVYFMFKNSRPDTTLFFALLVGLVIANVKGQIFRGSSVLFLLVIVVLLRKLIVDGDMTPRIVAGKLPATIERQRR